MKYPLPKLSIGPIVTKVDSSSASILITLTHNNGNKRCHTNSKMKSSIDNHHHHKANILFQSTTSSSCHQSTIQSYCQNQFSGKIFSQSIGIIQQTDKEEEDLLGKVYEFTFSNLKGFILFIFLFKKRS